jgi:hypothetical protein
MKSTLQDEVHKVNLDVYEGSAALWLCRDGQPATTDEGVAMTSTTGTVCPYCGWPDGAEPFQVVSRHATAAGRTEWIRCGCGSLQVRITDGCGLRVVSRSRPSAAQPSPANC